MTNLSASFAVALLSFVFVPVYIHALGVETWGLIGFFVSLQAILSLLDLGVSSALMRELARLTAAGSPGEASRNLTRTLECIYWCVAAVIGLTIWLSAPWLAEHWLKLAALSTDEAAHALRLMGIAFAARWPFALYAGALNGVERQPLLNALRVGVETLRSAGAALVLLFVSSTVTAFLLWQIGVAVLGSVIAAFAAWRALPPSATVGRFDLRELRRISRFMIGLSGIAVTVLVLTQADKLILSKLLSLEAFGYYTLAWAVASALGTLVGPLYNAYFPSLSRAVASGDEALVASLYHRASQFMSMLILPVGILLALFSYEVLALWTQNATLAGHTHTLLTILLLGTLINGLLNIPYAVLLAYGWTSLPFYANLIAMAVLVPAVVVLANGFGSVGAASVWLVLNAGQLLVTQHVMHARILRREKRAWFLNDVGKPALICIAVIGTTRLLLKEPSAFVFVAAALAALALSAALCVRFLDHPFATVRSLIARTSTARRAQRSIVP